MLRSTFTPIFFTFPTRPRIQNSLFRPIARTFADASPGVRLNAALALPPTIQAVLEPPKSAYIHLPFCRKRCHYCDFPIVALGSLNQSEDDPRMVNYIQLLAREIEATRAGFKTNPPLETVFFGGGTPSLVPPRLVSSILELLRVKFGLAADAEVSMEMDPGTFDARKMNDLMELGVNRVSLGVQAFQEELLKACGRAHGVEEVHEAIQIVKSCGVENWSMDLISSLPHQTHEMWEESLHLTIEASPAHVSVYDLQVEQGTKFGRLYSPGEFPLPSDSQSADFYRTASRILSNASYNHYEISSYGRDGFECKHNLTYWKNSPFYAFGLGSASYVKGLRFSRPRRMNEYMDYVKKLEEGMKDSCGDDHVEADDLAMDVVMLSLRTARGLDLRSFRESFGDSLLLSLCMVYEPYLDSGHMIFMDENRKVIPARELNTLLMDTGNITRRLAYMRLSDPDGFLLSNELISLAFGVITP
ncbi:hypothetical protein ACJRO7_008363 [Eucalyptus globulus]|uniref:Radical S-adenosyl methionine domain-containing protein 1, mitochondrial n=1 Tax=Eucalyptus globulus TaxID=34317 RepID=A0ABD3ISB9_EUCGL